MSFNLSPEVKLCEAILRGDIEDAQKRLDDLALDNGRWKNLVIKARRVTHPVKPLPEMRFAVPLPVPDVRRWPGGYDGYEKDLSAAQKIGDAA